MSETLRIETTAEAMATVHRLIGRIGSENLADIEAQIREDRGKVTLDLEEVMLVDRDAVHFLLVCEAEGIELLHRSPYIKEWMGRERSEED